MFASVHFISAWLVAASASAVETAAVFKNVNFTHIHTHTPTARICNKKRKVFTTNYLTNKFISSHFNTYAPNEIHISVFRCGVRNFSAASVAAITAADHFIQKRNRDRDGFYFQSIVKFRMLKFIRPLNWCDRQCSLSSSLILAAIIGRKVNYFSVLDCVSTFEIAKQPMRRIVKIVWSEQELWPRIILVNN